MTGSGSSGAQQASADGAGRMKVIIERVEKWEMRTQRQRKIKAESTPIPVLFIPPRIENAEATDSFEIMASMKRRRKIHE